MIDTDSLEMFDVYANTNLNTQLDTLKIHIQRFETNEVAALIDTIMATLE